jgi:hypothetical protein
MSSSLANRRPITSPSYTVMLFVVGNSSWITYLRVSPSGGWARHQPLLLWECRIRQSISPNDQVVYQFLTYLNQYIQQWSPRVLETWSLVEEWIQHHIGWFPLPTVWSTILLLCFGGCVWVVNRIRPLQGEPGSNAWTSWSSWELHRVASAPMGILYVHLSGFH